VAVDDERMGAEGLHPPGIAVHVPLEFGGTVLSQTVDVHDGGQVTQLVVGGLIQGLPHGAFGQFAVPAQNPDPVGQPVQVAAGQRHPDRVRQTLAQ
jgi:hypothetical protein